MAKSARCNGFKSRLLFSDVNFDMIYCKNEVDTSGHWTDKVIISNMILISIGMSRFEFNVIKSRSHQYASVAHLNLINKGRVK